MRRIAIVHLDKNRPALVLTRHSKLHLLRWVTVAPITSTISGITSEVRVGPRNGLDHDHVVSCDNITTVPAEAVGNHRAALSGELAPSIREGAVLRNRRLHAGSHVGAHALFTRGCRSRRLFRVRR